MNFKVQRLDASRKACLQGNDRRSAKGLSRFWGWETIRSILKTGCENVSVRSEVQILSPRLFVASGHTSPGSSSHTLEKERSHRLSVFNPLVNGTPEELRPEIIRGV